MPEFTLAALGWDDQRDAEFETYAAQGFVAARVAAEHRAAYVVVGEFGELRATARGRLFDAAVVDDGVIPAVGDWVAVQRVGEGGAIEAVLPRRTKVSRKETLKEAEEQVLVANVDMLVVVSGLDGDVNARRLERYLAIAYESGAMPVVVLTKLDLCEDPDALLAAEAVAIGVPVVAVSNVTGDGLAEFESHLAPAKTFALVGSSGVGKTTLINRLLDDDVFATAPVRNDGRGRHTTRHRQLIILPSGALLVDTPGIRELQLWEGDLDQAFDDIAQLAESCRFNDCGHDTEPGCAIKEALANGQLDPERLASYYKLQRELAAIEARRDRKLWAARKQRWRQRARETRAIRRSAKP